MDIAGYLTLSFLLVQCMDPTVGIENLNGPPTIVRIQTPQDSHSKHKIKLESKVAGSVSLPPNQQELVVRSVTGAIKKTVSRVITGRWRTKSGRQSSFNSQSPSFRRRTNSSRSLSNVSQSQQELDQGNGKPSAGGNGAVRGPPKRKLSMRERHGPENGWPRQMVHYDDHEVPPVSPLSEHGTGENSKSPSPTRKVPKKEFYKRYGPEAGYKNQMVTYSDDES